jgi:hypothetical protein
VSLHVWYEMACLLIREVGGSVPYSDEWEVAWSFAQAHMVQKGLWYRILPRKTLVIIAMVPRTTLVKPGIRPIVNLCNSM